MSTASAKEENAKLRAAFNEYAKLGHRASSGPGPGAPKVLTTQNFTKWLRDAKVIDNKHVTSQTCDIAYSKVIGRKNKQDTGATHKRPGKHIEFSDLRALLEQIADDSKPTGGKRVPTPTGDSAEKKDEPEEEKESDAARFARQLAEAKGPRMDNVTRASNAPQVARMTDTKLYTGSHSQKHAK